MPSGGSVIITGGPASGATTHAFTGTITLPLTPSGAATVTRGLTGSIALSLAATGDLTLIGGPVTHELTGTINLPLAATGDVNLQLALAGTINLPLSMSLVTGILRLTATGTDAIWYDAQSSSLGSNAVGNVVAAWVKVTDTSECAINQGPCLALADGRFLFAVRLRQDGLNIDGEAEVAVTLDDAFHLVVLSAKGETCTVSVDGRELQTGGPAGYTTKKAAGFGSHVSAAAI